MLVAFSCVSHPLASRILGCHLSLFCLQWWFPFPFFFAPSISPLSFSSLLVSQLSSEVDPELQKFIVSDEESGDDYDDKGRRQYIPYHAYDAEKEEERRREREREQKEREKWAPPSSAFNRTRVVRRLARSSRKNTGDGYESDIDAEEEGAEKRRGKRGGNASPTGADEDEKHETPHAMHGYDVGSNDEESDTELVSLLEELRPARQQNKANIGELLFFFCLSFFLPVAHLHSCFTLSLSCYHMARLTCFFVLVCFMA